MLQFNRRKLIVGIHLDGFVVQNLPPKTMARDANKNGIIRPMFEGCYLRIYVSNLDWVCVVVFMTFEKLIMLVTS